MAGVALAVLLIVWLLEGGVLKQEKRMEQKGPSDPSAQVAEEKPDNSPDGPVYMPAEPKATEAVETTPVAKETPKVALTAPKEKAVLPKVPTALLVVSGDQDMIPLARVHLESIVMDSGLQVASISEIPMLQEKVQFGRIPINWYVIEPLVPKGKAQFLVLAEFQRTGSTALKYYGRVQEMTTATFSVRSLDMASGVSVARPVSGSVKFTQLNMEKNLKDAIMSVSSGIGPEMKAHWEKVIHARDLQ
jgi:hypothetical protein